MADLGDECMRDILGETKLCLGKDERARKQRQRVCSWKRKKRSSSRHMGPAHSIQLPTVVNVDEVHDNDVDVECDHDGVSGDVGNNHCADLCVKPNDNYDALDKPDVSTCEDVFDEEDEISVMRIEQLQEALARVRLEGDAEMDALMIDESNEFEDVLDNTDLEVGCEDGPGSLWDDLRQMTNQTRLSTVQIDGMLKVLNSHPECVSARLPRSYKTLLRTGRDAIKERVKNISGHSYVYIGLQQQLLFYLDKYPKEVVAALDVIELVWNTDGLPLYNSRRINSWPVLCYIANIKPRVVFEVVLTSGEGKPTGTEYLDEFVSELGQLMREGIDYGGKHYDVVHKACVCDAPARAHVKHVKQFSAKVGCDWCEARGQHDGKRVVWMGIATGRHRTDERFRNESQPEYHRRDKQTPLLQLNIDMIKAFPPNFMHQSGGTVKKMLMWMVRGPRKSGNSKYVCRMSARNVQVLDERIRYIGQFMPDVFNRKLRTSIELSDYKYTELRQILLYTGKLLFLDITACPEQYEHFVLFSVACTLMVDPEKAIPYNSLETHLMSKVVLGFGELYGSSFMTYNVHVQQHMPEVAAVHGSLDSVSAYAFENHLGAIKKSVTSSHESIISLVKGLERRKANLKGQVLQQPEVQIRVAKPNNMYIDHHRNKVYEATAVIGDQVKVKEFLNLRNFFETPIPSSVIGCYIVCNSQWKFKYMPASSVCLLRRGIRIDLDGLPGLSDVSQLKHDRALCMTLLHNQLDALF